MSFSETPYPIVRKYNYVQLKAETLETGRKYLLPDGSWVPSVTTILNIIPKPHLDKWRTRLGIEEANRITEEACFIGSTMHDVLEGYVSNWLQGRPDVPPITEEEKIAYIMANRIKRFGLSDLDECWGIEEALFVNNLYAGRTDLIGIYNSKSSIIDYKSTRRPKKEEWIETYKLQISAYDLCHEEMTGEAMEQGVIIMAVRPPSTQPIQTFIMDKTDLAIYREKWLSLVEIYYDTMA